MSKTIRYDWETVMGDAQERPHKNCRWTPRQAAKHVERVHAKLRRQLGDQYDNLFPSA